MHQYKRIAQTLLVLSILNLVYASPVVPQEVRDTGHDAVVVAEDVTNVSDRRRGTQPGGTTGTSQYPSSLSEEYLSAGWNKLYQKKTNNLNTEASTSTSAHPLSAAGGPPPVPDSNAEASSSSHRPVPASTAEGSTTPHYAQITPDMLHKDPTKKLVAQKFAAFGLLVAVNAVATGIALYSVLHSNHKNSTGG
jgi:hypothetical protein